MTTIVVVVSYETDAHRLVDLVRSAGVSIMGVYSHEEYRDGVRYTPEPEMRRLMATDRFKLVEDENHVQNRF